MADGFCYVAKHPNTPGAYAACADLPEYASDTAKFVASEIKSGATVERVPTVEARRLLGVYIRWKGKQKSKKRRPPSTTGA
jgi:hypothetical protein